MRKNTKEQSQRHAKLKKQELVRAKKRELRKTEISFEQLNMAVDFGFNALSKATTEDDKVKWTNIIYTMLHKKFSEFVTEKKAKEFNLNNPDMKMSREEQIKYMVKSEFDLRKNTETQQIEATPSV